MQTSLSGMLKAEYVYWSKLPTQHGVWRSIFIKKIIFIKIVLPRTDEHDLLDENRKSCCTWSWLVLYGNHVCHSTVHWLSMIYFFKYQIFEICVQANGRWTLRRHFSISIISRLWQKYHQQCKMMNVHLIHLRHYLNKRSRAFPVCNKQILYWYDVKSHFA